jgi:signal transduction histidine kinase/CheY-like chemotaxis protein
MPRGGERSDSATGRPRGRREPSQRRPPGPRAGARELGGSLRDLVAISMLPAEWLDHDARQIAESIAEALVRQARLDFAYVLLRRGGSGDIEVAATAGRKHVDAPARIGRALAPRLGPNLPTETLVIANPFGDGSVRVVLRVIPTVDTALIVAASPRANFPTAAQRLLIGVVANQGAIAIRRFQAEHALQELNATLEQRIAAETKERMKLEEAFRHAQKLEAIGQLTGGMAHDFNNLLAVIIGNIESLQRRLNTEDYGLRRRLELANRAAARAATLTHQLLAFARRQPLEPKPIDVNRLIGALSDPLSRTLGETVAIEMIPGADLWPIRADLNQLESAILNLAINARDAMPDGGKLTIRTGNTSIDAKGTETEVPPGDYVSITVTDTGVGMPREALAKAFDPFFTTKPPGQGTGLGLSQVYGFVKQSGGHAAIRSALGEGTTVILQMPRLTGQHRHAEPPVPKQGAPAGITGETILVVEDDEDVRANTVELLEELGYRVLEAPDGAAALGVLEANGGVDLLFTDVALPGGLDGAQLADEVRKQQLDLPVLFTTGYARDAVISRHAHADLILKPFTFDRLAAKLRAMLESGRGHR